MQVTDAALATQVRDALANLYDPVALRAHPLARLLAPVGGLDSGSQGGPALRQRLIAAIDDLKPGPRVDENARASRPYRILQLRYVEGLDATEVQHRLALSKSQYYREHEAALASLVALISAGAAEVRGSQPTRDQRPDAVETVSLHAAETRGAPVVAATSGQPPPPATAPRWRAAGGFALGLLAALSLLFVAQKMLPPSTGAKGGSGQQSPSSAPPTVTLSVYAGTGEAGYVNGPAASAQFAGQLGLTVDSHGEVDVADTGNNRVRRIGTNALVLDVAGSGVAGYADGPATTAEFSSPNALAVVSDGTIYVADAGNLRIRAISPTGDVSTLAGSGVAGYADGVGTAAQFAAAGAIAADSSGNVYVPDPINSVIRKITPAGVVSTFAGSGERGHVDGPPNVAEFDRTVRIAGDSRGSIYVVDTGDSRIRKITAAGVVSTIAGTGSFGYSDGPATQAQFSNDIRGICVDSAGNLYAIDAGNRRVREVTANGMVSTLFELTDPNQTPWNMKADPAGNLYLSDREHNRIYKLTIRRGG